MSGGNLLRKQLYNGKRAKRDAAPPAPPTTAAAAAAAAAAATSSPSMTLLPPAISNRPATELVVGGVYILITAHNLDDRRFAYSLYVQRTPHFGTVYQPSDGDGGDGDAENNKQPRTVFSLVPRALAPMPATGGFLVAMVLVDCLLPAAATTADERMRRATLAVAAATARSSRSHGGGLTEERPWILNVLRELWGGAGRSATPLPDPAAATTTRTEASYSELWEAVDIWTARLMRDDVGPTPAPFSAPVAFWWREDWPWEVVVGLPCAWRDLAHHCRYTAGKNSSKQPI